MSAEHNLVYTIGHSTHATEAFLELLRKQEVTAVVHLYSSIHLFVREQWSEPRRKDWFRLPWLAVSCAPSLATHS